MNDFTILHLSDLHINQKGERLSILMEKLLIDIKQEMKLVDNIIVVVTGDIVHKGNYNYKENAIAFFKELKKVLKEKVKDIYIVPGNHDKVRNSIDSKIIQEYKLEGDVADKFYKDYWKYIMVSFADYQDMVKKIYEIFVDKTKVKKKVKANTYGVFVTEINDKRICFMAFNTAWSCLGDTDERNLKFGKFQLDEIKEEYKENMGKLGYDLVIAMAHHPLNWLTGEEETLLQTNILSNFSLNCNIYISGHIHNRDIINWQSTRHSLTTLVSGIGWPDEEEDMQHPYAHTYSSYTFNLDINSIDVYVRSSDDNSSFEPDFRIYTKKRDKANSKIVMPIDSNKTQAYFNLGAVKGRSPKSYYITEKALSLIQIYTPMVGKFRKQMYVSLNRVKKDILDQIIGYMWYEQEKLDNEKDPDRINMYEENIEKIEDNWEMLDECFFRGMDLNEDARNFLEEHSEIIDKCLISYMQNICSSLSKLLEENLKKIEMLSSEKKGEEPLVHTARVHFRGYNIETDEYESLCLGDSLTWSSYQMRNQKWGELLEEAYKAKHSLVASVNQTYCCKSYDINDQKKENTYKWIDFMTYIPDFIGNDYVLYDVQTDKIIKQRPWITFGITVYAKKNSNMLYILDYLEIGQIITDCFKEFKTYMPINMERFVKGRLQQKWE